MTDTLAHIPGVAIEACGRAIYKKDVGKVKTLLSKHKGLASAPYQGWPMLRHAEIAAQQLDPDDGIAENAAYCVTRLLLEYGASPEELRRILEFTTDNAGESPKVRGPLYDINCSAPFVRALVEHGMEHGGIDWEERNDPYNFTPLQKAITDLREMCKGLGGPKDRVSLQLQVIRELARVCDVNAPMQNLQAPFDGFPPLFLLQGLLLAEERDKTLPHQLNYVPFPAREVCQILIDAGADVEMPLLDNKTLLQHSVDSNNGPGILVMLRAGANQKLPVENNSLSVPSGSPIRSFVEERLTASDQNGYEYLYNELKAKTRTALFDKTDALHGYLVHAPRGKMMLTPLAKALAEFKLLNAWFDDCISGGGLIARHGGWDNRKALSERVEELLPPHLSGATGMIENLRESPLSRPNDSATVKYVRASAPELKL